ncbi:23S rRNA (guanosine(2251)-2'-O)-methyltransferase RlmB [Microlunatus parietis]|uniref:23S rRNA (Guanosine2251-2'-O)-methyltransferase n=1 Tax=Microlunatus parietis TaxID=682979 RepID=A0A7Y9LDZ2_9ACTN|nr:23S rRNA (guanosine(2251)-2'-O)-methyltransferase RlmB [Microlunatus parietis]NYE73320.1 23S rRNA (guanosine2251-2'-O)-methyltransferase [Microlunatus parietis]
MPGNSQRKGAVRRKGKGRTAGSGGRVRRGLEGKGPTPKAEDRPYHPAHKAKLARNRAQAGRPDRGPDRKRSGGADWVVGRNPVLEALQAGVPVKTGYIADGADRDDRLREILRLAAEQHLPLLQVSRSELDRLTADAVHQGVALQLPEYNYAHPDDLLEQVLDAGDRGLAVALDGVSDPRNLGAIVRSAAAFGAQGVLIPERRAAGMSAAAWKSSAGAAARLPVARATNLNRALRAYSEAGVTLVGLDAGGEASIAELTGDNAGGPTMLVIGGEGAGLSRLVREACDVIASIPIAADVESLNAGVAAGIALYELSRS